MEVLKEFEQAIQRIYEKNIERATEYMDETQREIYKIGFDNAVAFAKTFIIECDLEFRDVEL